MSNEAILVLCTAPNAEEAERLAKGIVEAGLAACVNVVAGLRSFYVWDGKLQDDTEVQLLIKTREERAVELRDWIGEHHGYDVPEILFVPITGGSERYLAWLRERTSR